MTTIAGGSVWDDVALDSLFDSLAGTQFGVQVLPQCGFLHFGTTRQTFHVGLGSIALASCEHL